MLSAHIYFLIFHVYSSGVKVGISRKDELFNSVLDNFFKHQNLDFPRSVVETEGTYIVQVRVKYEVIFVQIVFKSIYFTVYIWFEVLNKNFLFLTEYQEYFKRVK